MDSQELTGGNAVRQTGKVAMKKENPCLIFEAGTNNKGAIPVTGHNRRLASPSGNVQGYRWQLTRHAAPRNAGQSSPYTLIRAIIVEPAPLTEQPDELLPGWRRLSDRHPANDKSVSYR